jgi:hypothetical protein
MGTGPWEQARLVGTGRNEEMTGRLGMRRQKLSPVLLLLGALSASALSSGCRVSSDEIEQWSKKKNGPRKLTAVLTHDKYGTDLRVEAAMTLATMKPRGGRSVGLLGDDQAQGLLAALASLPSDKRDQVVLGMVPKLTEGILLERPADGTDPSLPFKDAAFALLTNSGTDLVTSAEARDALKGALAHWCQSSFEARFDDTSQLYGMEQVLRLVRAPGVRNLPALIAPDFKHMANVAKLVHELGDEETQLEASKKLVATAEAVNAPAWRARKAEGVKARNAVSGIKVTEKQFEKQLEAYQEEELLRVFSAMKSVGKAPVAEYLIAYAKKEENPEKRRASALAALEGNLDRKNPAHAAFILDVLSNNKAPDSLRDVASRRVGELPREQVAERLYGLFGSERWQVRWTAASLLLKMTEAKDLPEFMNRLGKIKHMALSEPLAYGPLLSEVKGEPAATLASRYAAGSFPTPVRLSALGYFYRFGDVRDTAWINQYATDKDKVPSCPAKAEECEWKCDVAAANGASESKEVETIGDFVSYCIVPALKSRPEPAPTGASPATPPPSPQK